MIKAIVISISAVIATSTAIVAQPREEPGAKAEKGKDVGNGILVRDPKTPCPVKVLAARHAFSVCIAKVWNVRTDNYYCCPPDKTLYIETTNTPTKHECEPGVAPGRAGWAIVLPFPEAPRPCVGEEIEEPITVSFCNGHNWVTRVYSVVKCEKTQYTNGYQSETVGGVCPDKDPPYTPNKKC
jgi:hypothetical protein